MSADNPGSQPEDAEKTDRRKPVSELWGPWQVPQRDDQDTRPAPAVQIKKPGDLAAQALPSPAESSDIDPQASYREHISGSLPSPASFSEGQPGIPPAGPQGPHSAYPLPNSGYNHPAANMPGAPPASGYPPIQSYPPPGQGYPPAPTYPGMAAPGMPVSQVQPSHQGYASGPPLPPGYPPYGAYNGFAPSPNALYPPYPPYAPYPAYPPYMAYRPAPKRDGYLYGVGIASLVGSILVLIGGFFALLVLILLNLVPTRQLASEQLFMSTVTLLAFALIGIIGGGYSLYHSIRSVFLRRPSAPFALPTFWLFVALYVAVIVVGFVLHARGQDLDSLPLADFLILMAGLTPALAVLALGDRRLRPPRSAEKRPWPTTWRRFTLAIVSGATLGVLVAGVLEFVFQVALVRSQGVNVYLCLDNPSAPPCQSQQVYTLLLIALAIVAPLVEEAVKPLAVIILIGRMRSAAEAFVLGLSCGIGFDLIETSGYISAGYTDWLRTALERTGAGLLHGLGAAMVALGWYYITRPGNRRVLKALGCWLYAVIQHAVWNGSLGLTLLPGSAGQFFSNTFAIGPVTFYYFELVNLGEAVIILLFFLYITGRLRQAPPSTNVVQQAPA